MPYNINSGGGGRGGYAGAPQGLVAQTGRPVQGTGAQSPGIVNGIGNALGNAAGLPFAQNPSSMWGQGPGGSMFNPGQTSSLPGVLGSASNILGGIGNAVSGAASSLCNNSGSTGDGQQSG